MILTVQLNQQYMVKLTKVLTVLLNQQYMMEGLTMVLTVQLNQQYMVEGLTMGSLMVLAGTGLIILQIAATHKSR